MARKSLLPFLIARNAPAVAGKEVPGGSALVLDPGIPDGARSALASVATGALPSFRASAAQVRAKVAEEMAAQRAERSVSWLMAAGAAVLVLGLTAVIVSIVAAVQQGNLNSSLYPGLLAQIFNPPTPITQAQAESWQGNINALSGASAGCGIAAGAALLCLLFLLVRFFRLRHPSSVDVSSIDPERPEIAYHGHYVVPSRDIPDAECRALWGRAVAALARVSRSRAVESGLIDRVPVAAITPYIAWEIARLLASICALRAHTTGILEESGVSRDHYGVAAILAGQDNEDASNIAYAERRVGALEAFAGLAAEVDQEVIVMNARNRLEELNDAYLDLHARRATGDIADPVREIADEFATHRDSLRRKLSDANEAAGAAFLIQDENRA
jgi:hypothetical protein